MKQKGLLLAISLAASFAYGETFYWNGDSGGREETNCVVGAKFACWTNETHKVAVGPANDNVYIMDKGYGSPQTFAGSYRIFPGAELHIGSPGNSRSQLLLTRTTGRINFWQLQQGDIGMFVTNLYWYCGVLRSGTGQSVGSNGLDDTLAKTHVTGFSGTMHVVNTGVGTQQHHVEPGTADKHGPRNTCFACNLIGEEGVEITCKGNTSDYGVEERLDGVRLYLTGDNSAYKGSFRAWNWYTVSLLSDTALGDPNTPNPAALKLGTNGGVEVSHLVNLGSSRGITLIDGEKGAFETTFSTETVRHSLPITGKGLPFRTIGLGTIIYSGVYSAGDWTVEKGTLQITSEATLPERQKFIVKSGATLILAANKSDCMVTCEEGGRIVFDGVAYDNETGTSTPIDFTNFGEPELPFTVKLTERVDRTNDIRIAVMKLPVGSTVTTNDLFIHPDSVITPLFATFEIEESGESRMVYLNVEAHGNVVCFTPEAANAGVRWGIEELSHGDIYTWSDHQQPHAGSHYMITNGHPGTAQTGWAKEMTFKGDSLSVITPGNLYTRNTRATFKRIYFGPNTLFDGNGCGYGDLPHWLDGEIVIGGTSDKPVRFSSRWASAENNGQLDYAKNSIGIAGDLRGNGYLTIDGSTLADVRITKTNELFKGCITFAPAGDEVTNCAIAISHPYAIGGPLAPTQTNYNALVFGGAWGFLKPLETMTLNTPGRGITFKSGYGGFCVPAGVTLTVSEPIRSKAGICKSGDGLLVITTPIEFGLDGNEADNGGNSSFSIYGGGIKPVNGVTFRGEKIFVKGPARIVLDPDASDDIVRNYGLFNEKYTSFIFSENCDLTVEIEGAEGTSRNDVTIAVPICTVTNQGDSLNADQAADRIRAHLKLAKAWSGYKGRIVEDVPADYPKMVRFTAVYEKQGFYLIVK